MHKPFVSCAWCLRCLDALNKLFNEKVYLWWWNGWLGTKFFFRWSRNLVSSLFWSPLSNFLSGHLFWRLDVAWQVKYDACRCLFLFWFLFICFNSKFLLCNDLGKPIWINAHLWCGSYNEFILWKTTSEHWLFAEFLDLLQVFIIYGFLNNLVALFVLRVELGLAFVLIVRVGDLIGRLVGCRVLRRIGDWFLEVVVLLIDVDVKT